MTRTAEFETIEDAWESFDREGVKHPELRDLARMYFLCGALGGIATLSSHPTAEDLLRIADDCLAALEHMGEAVRGP